MVAGLVLLVILAFRGSNVGRHWSRFSRGRDLCLLCAVDKCSNPSRKSPRRVPDGFASFSAPLGLRRGEAGAQLRPTARVASPGTGGGETDASFQFRRSGFPSPKHFTVAVRYAPITSVAGDFSDSLNPEGERPGLLVADVEGDGVPVSLDHIDGK